MTAILPLKPNWGDAVDVERVWRTDVVRSRDGHEQRRSLRRTPRRTISFSASLDAAQTRSLERVLVSSQSGLLVLADPLRMTRVVAAAASGATTVTVAEVPEWLTAAASLVIGGGAQVVVDAVNTSTGVVTLVAPLTVAVSARSEVRPALLGRLAGNLGAVRRSSAVTQARVSFALDPGSEAVDDGEPLIDLHGGREVLFRKPNWGNTVDDDFAWTPETIDFGFGVIASSSPIAFGAATRRLTFTFDGTEYAQELAQFYSRQRGMRGEFLLPTWLDDLPLASDIDEDDETLTIAGIEPHAAFSDDLVHQSVAIMLRDGRRIYRSITNWQTSSGNTVVTLDAPFLSSIARSDVLMVSWAPVVRFASDEFVSEWLTSEVAQATVAATELPAATAEGDLQDYDGAAKWVLEVWGDGTITSLDRLNEIVNVLYPEASDIE